MSDIPARYAAATGAQSIFRIEGSRGLCAVKWKLPPHHVRNLWAPHHALGYRVNGLATITRRREGVDLRRAPGVGSVTFSPGDRPTEWQSDAPIEAIHLYIAAEALPPPAVPDLFGARDPWLSFYFRLLEAECALGEPDSLFLDQTQPLLVRHLAGGAMHASGGRGRVTPLRRGVTRRIEEHVDAHMGEAISLAELAELARMSVDHFVRAFRAATGSTPHRFVLERRLGEAAARLRRGDATVAEIARACGFRSAAHFSVQFHARFGLTPTQYRRSA